MTIVNYKVFALESLENFEILGILGLTRLVLQDSKLAAGVQQVLLLDWIPLPELRLRLQAYYWVLLNSLFLRL
jgi:hypothetical protein